MEGDDPYIDFFTDDSTRVASIGYLNDSLSISNKNNTDIVFYNGSTQQSIINSDGNMGIGISNPSQKLEVDGAASANVFMGTFEGDGSQVTNIALVNLPSIPGSQITDGTITSMDISADAQMHLLN